MDICGCMLMIASGLPYNLKGLCKCVDGLHVHWTGGLIQEQNWGWPVEMLVR